MEALQWFAEAVRLFDEAGDGVEMQNARVNCLLCKVGIDEGLDLDATEADIRDIQGDLDAGGHWQQRKSYILLARVEERRGYPRQAMRWARKALNCTRSEQSQYYDLDRGYLAALRKKFVVLMMGGARS